jgi:hypothetical protein
MFESNAYGADELNLKHKALHDEQFKKTEGGISLQNAKENRVN